MLDKGDLDALQAMLDNSLRNSENVILKELDRVQDNLQIQIDELRKEVKHNNQLISMLNMIDDLRRRIEELEKKSA